MWALIPSLECVLRNVAFMLGASAIVTGQHGGSFSATRVFRTMLFPREEADEKIGVRTGRNRKRIEPSLRRTNPFAFFVDKMSVEGKNSASRSRLLHADFSLYRSAPNSINALSSGESESMFLPPRNHSWGNTVCGEIPLSACGILTRMRWVLQLQQTGFNICNDAKIAIFGWYVED